MLKLYRVDQALYLNLDYPIAEKVDPLEYTLSSWKELPFKAQSEDMSYRSLDGFQPLEELDAAFAQGVFRAKLEKVPDAEPVRMHIPYFKDTLYVWQGDAYAGVLGNLDGKKVIC